jgi:hypothetical protein
MSAGSLAFIMAREMGRCHAKHDRVITLALLIGGGYITNLSRDNMQEIEELLSRWIPSSEILADRAGALAVGDIQLAETTLLAWYLRSTSLADLIDLQTLKQPAQEYHESTIRLSDVLNMTVPLISRRLSYLDELKSSTGLSNWKSLIEDMPDLEDEVVTASEQTAEGEQPAEEAEFQHDISRRTTREVFRMICTGCKTPLRVPKSVLEGKEAMNIQCPNPECARVFTIRKKDLPNGHNSESETTVELE